MHPAERGEQRGRQSMKQLVFLIYCPQEYLSHSDFDTFEAEANRFFMMVSEVHLPLLEMFRRLESCGIQYKIALVLPAALLTMLQDSFVQDRFKQYLEKKIDLGQHALLECKEDIRSALSKMIEDTKEKKRLFEEEYGKDLCAAFDGYRKRGNVEILATCGTDIFLPHYIDMEETISAQVETGLYAYKTFFTDAAEGFFLPEMGYAAGIEQILRSYGVRYTVLDGRAVLFSEDSAPCGLFQPVLCTPSCPTLAPLAAFPRDNRIDSILFGNCGYSSAKEYCNTEKDLAFSLKTSLLDPFIPKGKPRFPSLYRCYNRTGGAYNEEAARAAAVKDAEHFVEGHLGLFEKAQAALPSSPLSLTCTINACDFVDRWREGIFFIESIFRNGKEVSFASFKDVLRSNKNLAAIRPYFSASSDTGYGEELNNGANSWMLPLVRRASHRMTLLAERFYDGSTLKSRLLNLGAKELLFAQSASWQKRAGKQEKDEYARRRFFDSIEAFTTVFEDLGSNSFTPAWLTALEAEHPIFPWINYKIFCKKH